MIWQVVVLMIGRWDWYLTRVSIPVEGPHSMIRYVHGIRYEMGHTNLLLEQVLVVGLLIWLASLTRSVDCGMGLGIYYSINRISEGVPIHIRALVHFPSVPGLDVRPVDRASYPWLQSPTVFFLLPNSLWERILTLGLFLPPDSHLEARDEDVSLPYDRSPFPAGPVSFSFFTSFRLADSGHSNNFLSRHLWNH